MLNRSILRRIAITMSMVVFSSFAVAGAGHTAQQALFSFKYSAFGAAALVGGVSITIPRFTVSPSPNYDPFSATIGSGPTPSVMWPSKILDQVFTGYAGGTITPSGMENPSAYGLYFSFVQQEMNYNKAATFSKSGGLSAPTTFGWPATTTICNNTCLPRPGTGWQTPGSDKFGGTAKLIDWSLSSGLKKNITLMGFTQQYFAVQSTSMLTGPGFPGQYGKAGDVYITTPNSAYFSSPIHLLFGRYSTGTAMAMMTVNDYNTTATKTGSNNLNPTNLTGMISLVRPFIQSSWAKTGGVVQELGGGNVFAAVNILEVTFLPEPSQLAMLGAGVLGVGVLYGRRYRRGSV